MVVWAIAKPCSLMMVTRSRELNLKLKYQRTHRITISWSKCRPLKSSCTGTNRDICLSSPTGIHVCTRAPGREFPLLKGDSLDVYSSLAAPLCTPGGLGRDAGVVWQHGS